MKPTEVVLAIDQGTTGTRAIIFDVNGTIISSAYLEHKQYFPQSGWVEHDPAEIWKNTIAVIKSALKKGDIDPSKVVSVGITNQRETTVVWDRSTGKSLAPAIVWQDLRTAEMCENLKKDKEIEKQINEKTGLPISTYFSATKLHWILKDYHEIAAKAREGMVCFGTIDSWLIANLTGNEVHATDVTNASRTTLMNLETLRWDEDLLQIFEIPEPILPEIKPSLSHYGDVNVKEIGIEAPIYGVLGDQQAALVGQQCFEPGQVKVTYGTGAFILLNIGEKILHSKNGLLTTVAYQIEGQKPIYAFEGSIAIAGAAVQWLRDQLNIISSAPEIERLASEVPDNGGVYFVPAFSGLFAPYWDTSARGLIIGLTRFSDKRHLARATLESIAFQVHDVLNVMEKDSSVNISELRVDGGASKNNLLLQIQADILQIPCLRPKIEETTSLGAALFAGIGAKVWNDFKDVSKIWQLDKKVEPRMEDEKRMKLITDWERAIERAKQWIKRD